MNALPVLLKDFYKVGHVFQYPKGTTLVYSNLTPRSSRIDGDDAVVAFGFQAFILEYLIKQFNWLFFQEDKGYVVDQYRRRVTNALGPGISVDHIAALHDLGYLPIRIKAVPEGTLVPLRVPLLTIRNTHDDFFWLTNMLETLMSAELWGPITSATTAFGYRKVFEEFARKTGASKEFVKWQGHDFSMRGLYGVDAAIKSGAAHLLSFTGTDTIPAIDFLEEYYGANSDRELIGGSVPATEHSVMSMGGQDGEFETFRRLVAEVYPSAIVSIVSDTWDLWEVIGSYLPRLRDTIKAREGKVVIRPDSGDPVKVLCGDPEAVDSFVRKGVVECLWDIFGGTTNASGFRELDPHIGTIYGDSINRERQRAILEGLAKKGFASSNVVLGIGSYTYQHVTRDTYGLAVKATYGEVNGNMRPIFKAPKTDDGIKNSAKGLLVVEKIDGTLKLTENVQWVHEGNGVLQTIFLDGKLHNRTTLAEIRARIEEQL